MNFKHLCILFSFGIVSCTPRMATVSRVMSFDDAKREIDSLCNRYYVNVDTMTDYMKYHPIPLSEKGGLENVVLRHSPLNLGVLPPLYSWEDSIGSFKMKPVKTDIDRICIKDLRDSIFISHPFSFYFSAQDDVMIDNHKVGLYFSFHNMYPDKEQAFNHFQKAYIVNEETNDTTYLDVMNHRWSILRNPPLVLFQVFDLKIDSCYYTIHMINDRRLMTDVDYQKHSGHLITYYKIKNFKIGEDK